jgi:hypothetical protein
VRTGLQHLDGLGLEAQRGQQPRSVGAIAKARLRQHRAQIVAVGLDAIDLRDRKGSIELRDGLGTRRCVCDQLGQ